MDISKYMEDIKKWCKNPERLLKYENSIREAIKQNKEEEDLLKISDFISDDLWKRIIDAINYDNATTVRWATKKLGILYKKNQLGERIFVPSINVYLEKNNFESVICKEFSCFIFNEILKFCQTH